MLKYPVSNNVKARFIIPQNSPDLPTLLQFSRQSTANFLTQVSLRIEKWNLQIAFLADK